MGKFSVTYYNPVIVIYSLFGIRLAENHEVGNRFDLAEVIVLLIFPKTILTTVDEVSVVNF